MIIIYLCIFFLGSSIASFVNATLYRIDNGYKYPKILYQGSHCEKCKRELTWIDLIPVLGYIITKGKCSKCKSSISIYYPISEFFLGVTSLLFYLYEVQIQYWFVLLFLFVLSYYDNIYRAIPQNIVHIFLVVCTFFFLLFNFNLLNLVLPIILSITLLLVNLLKKSFGMGDILVLLGMGILLSYKEFIILFWFGIAFALIYSMWLVVKEKVDVKKAKVPMVPFFMFSFCFAVIDGNNIFEKLLNILII